MRAASCSRGRPEWMRCYGIPPTVAIEQRLSRGGRKARWPPPPGLALPAPAVGEAGPAALRGRRAVRAAERRSIAAQILRDHRASMSACWRPLVVNRKGVYTDLAKWAKARGPRTCAWTASSSKVDPFPQLDRFKGHTLELPVVRPGRSADNEAELRRCWPRRWTWAGRDAPARAAGRPEAANRFGTDRGIGR